MEAFKRKGGPKEEIKPDHFYTWFDEEWKVVGKCDKAKGYELEVVNWYL